jgi:Uncharacterised protein family (UPF0236)
VVEHLFWQEGRVVRPFCRSAGVRCRGYSQPLERRMTDFGADMAFGQVPAKLKEHYGIEVPVSAVRHMTEAQARAIHAQEQFQTSLPAQGVAWVIAETDGSMIPIVDTAAPETGAAEGDRRKTRQVRWQEARLSLAHAQGSVTPRFAATFGAPEAVGEQLRDCALRVGFGSTSRVHSVGDGAPWIAEQVHRVFGPQGTYLVDFYHVSEYLAAAAARCAPETPAQWLAQQQAQLKQSDVAGVQAALAPHLEARAVTDQAAPVRCCYRYLTNRPGQFDYQQALAAELPIGSGEIESAHRYVIQQRLKLAGAWWKEETAADMLALRTLRANGEWNQYWAALEQTPA